VRSAFCHSGSRSAFVLNQLAEAGFKTVYNITDGVEGDVVKDTIYEMNTFGPVIRFGYNF
jgi:hypothetical protein